MNKLHALALRLRKGSLIYAALKALNTLLTLIWGFLLTFCMTRAVGAESYGGFVFIAALGIYLASADFGISNLVYADTRKAYVQGGNLQNTTFAPAIALYIAICLLASFAFAAYQIIRPSPWLFEGLLFFAFSTLNLPWLMIRSSANAMDQHLRYEIADFSRRTIQSVAMSATLLGFKLLPVMLVMISAWVLSAAWVVYHIAKQSHLPVSALLDIRPKRLALLRKFAAGIKHSIVFSVSEFTTYNFAYIMVPFLTKGHSAIIIFDTFYKVFRAGISCNQIASTALLPAQSHAFFSGDKHAAFKATTRVAAFSIAISLAASACLLVVGPHIFPLLLNKQVDISTLAIVAMCAAIVGNAVQNTAGSLLVNLGFIRNAQWVAVVIFIAMISISYLYLRSGAPIDRFVMLYATLYCVGALLWGSVAVRAIRNA